MKMKNKFFLELPATLLVKLLIVKHVLMVMKILAQYAKEGLFGSIHSVIANHIYLKLIILLVLGVLAIAIRVLIILHVILVFQDFTMIQKLKHVQDALLTVLHVLLALLVQLVKEGMLKMLNQEHAKFFHKESQELPKDKMEKSFNVLVAVLHAVMLQVVIHVKMDFIKMVKLALFAHLLV